MLKRKLKGGALYIALIVCVVIGIILSAFILIAHYDQRQVYSQSSYNQLKWNLSSGFNIAQSQDFSENLNNRWQKQEFNGDSIRIKKLQWGAYDLIIVESKNKHQYLKQAGLFGTAIAKDTAIMVADRGRPISLSGKIKFNGYCYFPKSGYKAAYIEGESFNSEGNINSFIKQAPSEIPEIKEQLKKNIEACTKDLNPATDSLIGDLSANINNSFSSKTAILKSSQLDLKDLLLTNNIKLIVSGRVTIENSAHLNNILIVAGKVIIKKGFKGCLQIIATDSIILEKECTLEYPSSLTILNKETKDQNLKGVFIGEKSSVKGSILAISPENSNSKMIISLGKECEIYGLIYSSHYGNIQGKIFGNLYCDKFLFQSPSAVYENHILNCEADSKKHSKSLVIPAIFEKTKSNKCLKWI